MAAISCLDAGGEDADLGGEGVDLVEQDPGQLGVVLIEPAGQRLTSAACLTRIRPRARPASTCGSRSPAISASIIARPGAPMMSVATVESLIRASSSSFSIRWACRDRSRVRSSRSRV